MTERESLPEQDELLAAELSLGLLEAEQRAAAEKRVASEPLMAEAHDRWAARFSSLFAGLQETAPPSLWQRIDDSLPANDEARVAPSNATLRWWQAGALAASAVAAVLAVMVVSSRTAPAPVPPAARNIAAPDLVATLTAADRAAVVTVSFDPVSGRLTSAPSRLAVGARSAELWIIPTGQSPHSLGVIAAQRPSQPRPSAAAAALLAPDATLAISLEPIGGSPTGAPTGPVILSGKAVSL